MNKYVRWGYVSRGTSPIKNTEQTSENIFTYSYITFEIFNNSTLFGLIEKTNEK